MKYLIPAILLLTGCTSMSLNSQIMPDGTEKLSLVWWDRGVFSPSEIRHYEYTRTRQEETRVCKDVSMNTVVSQDESPGEWGAAAIHGVSILGTDVSAIDATAKIGKDLVESGDVVNNSLDNSNSNKNTNLNYTRSSAKAFSSSKTQNGASHGYTDR